VDHKMALRPNILTDAAFDVAFEASILLQDTDINFFAFACRASKPMNTAEEIFVFVYLP
jgi:hypothetical protein